MLSRTLSELWRVTRRLCVSGVAFAILTFVLTHASQAGENDWQMLFDGKTLDAWKPSADNKQFKVVDGVIVGSSSAQTHFLHTVKEYGDFDLELEVKLHDEGLNSGVQIRTSLVRENDKGVKRNSVHGPQVDLSKSPGRSGHIFNQGNGAWITPQKDLVQNKHMINGEWNKVRVLAVGRKIETWINGKQVADLTVPAETHEKYSKGVIALQVHGVKDAGEKTHQVSFRAIRIRDMND